MILRIVFLLFEDIEFGHSRRFSKHDTIRTLSLQDWHGSVSQFCYVFPTV
jgi:hypothetical protein